MSSVSISRAVSRGYSDIFITYPALGDQVLLLYAAQIRHQATGQKTLVGTTAPELFDQASSFCDVLEGVSALTIGTAFTEIASAGLRVFPLTYYVTGKTAEGKLQAGFPQEHLLTRMCGGMGINGRISIDPDFPLTDEEKQFGRFFIDSQIAVMSEGKEQRKTWGAENMQAVIDALRHRYNFVQIGAPSDAPLRGALDKRGAFPLRSAAATLYNSDLFIGGIGALMHMARGVGCPAVITYSLSEPLVADSYPCNANILAKSGCSRCQTDLISPAREALDCADNFSCIRAISVDDVVAAVENTLTRTSGINATAMTANIVAHAAPPLTPVTARVYCLAQKQGITKKA